MKASAYLADKAARKGKENKLTTEQELRRELLRGGATPEFADATIKTFDAACRSGLPAKQCANVVHDALRMAKAQKAARAAAVDPEQAAAAFAEFKAKAMPIAQAIRERNDKLIANADLLGKSLEGPPAADK